MDVFAVTDMHGRTIGGVLLVLIEELIPYLSDNCKKFKTYPKYVKKTEIKALNAN